MRPILMASLVGPSHTVARLSLLDTGADETIFTESLAQAVGLDLSHAPAGETYGFGGRPFPLRYGQVNLRLTDGIEFREWPALVGFTSAPLPRQILGIAGCLEFFTAAFHGDREEVELNVNSKYPGT